MKKNMDEMSTHNIKKLGDYYFDCANYEKAKECYEKAASHGDADAYYRLGELYFDGLGVSVDHNKSLYYHENHYSLVTRNH